ncbi:MAG: hypothetical protein JSW07_03980 [bacterium]|nr:MAG: hypothetical protein JSW07_03980 [bacterium]
MNKYQVLVTSLLLVFLFSSLMGTGKDDSQIGLEPGKILPAFKLPNLEGKEIALQDFLGSIVIIHLWKCK